MASALKGMGHRPFAYPAQRLHENGTLVKDASLLRRALVEELGLKPRDIVLLFSKDGRLSFDLNVRRASVLLSLGRDGPAVIVARSSAWVIPRGGPVNNMGQLVQRRFLEVVSMTHTSSEGDHVRRPGQAEELHSGPVAERVEPVPTSEMLDSVPFALAVTEALLVMFLERLRTALQRAEAEGAALLTSFASTGSAEISAFKLEVLRRTKQRLDYLRGQAKGLQQTLFEALGDEDDMSQLASAVGPTSEEWELCFEYYSHGAEEVGLEAMRQLEGLEDLERSISLRLSSRRLELEQLQIYLDVLNNGLSLAAVLTGAFGMNLLSGIENRPRTFWPVFVGIFGVSGAMSVGLRLLVGRRLHSHGGTTAVWVTRGRRQSEGVGIAAPRLPNSHPPHL